MKEDLLMPFPKDNSKARKLKPCPFCGAGAGMKRVRANPDYWTVGCGGCEAEGPTKSTKQEARDEWNARTAFRPATKEHTNETA